MGPEGVLDPEPEQLPGKAERALPSQNSSSRFPKPARYSAHFRKKSVWPFCRLWNTWEERGEEAGQRKVAGSEFSICQDGRAGQGALRAGLVFARPSVPWKTRSAFSKGRGSDGEAGCDVDTNLHPAM